MPMLFIFSALITSQSLQSLNCLGSGTWNILGLLETIAQKLQKKDDPGASVRKSPQHHHCGTKMHLAHISMMGKNEGLDRPPHPWKPSVMQLIQESQIQRAFLASPSSPPFCFCSSNLSLCFFLTFPFYFLMVWIFSESLWGKEEGFR